MKRLATLFILSLLTLLLTFCDSGTDPIELEPGSHKYFWTEDTIKFIYNGYDRIWGSSPEDLWISASSGPGEAVLLHYDGTEWKFGGKDGLSGVWSIWGSGKHDVWAGTDDGEIWHYGEDKQWAWRAGFIYQPERNKIITFYDIWGGSSTSVYAVGTAFHETDDEHPVIATYNGKKWSIKHFPELEGAFVRVKGDNKGRIYIWSLKLSNVTEDSTYIYQYENGIVKKIFAARDTKANRVNLQTINGEVIFVIGEQLCRYTSGSFIPFFTNTKPQMQTQVYGRHSKDIFIPAHNGITHYNGSEQKYALYIVADQSVRNQEGIIFAEDIFFLMRDNDANKSVIYHGELIKE